MRLIDADAFADFLKNAIKTQKYDALKVNGDTLTVEDVLESIIAELDGTSLDGFKNNPTIEPQRMKGKWDARGWNNAYWKCSNCDELTVFPFDFCPFCGSDMRGEEDAVD